MALGPEFAPTLAAAQAGDERAWRVLYDELSGPLLGYLRGRGARDAENLLGEVFLQLARGLSRFDGGEEALRGWAFLIARNRVLDERRSASRRPVEYVDDGVVEQRSGSDVEAEALARLGDGSVQQVLSELTAEQRDVLLLRVIADLSLEDVARIIGKRPGAVKQLQRRALATMRKKLEINRGSVTP